MFRRNALLFSNTMLRKVFGLVAECLPSLQRDPTAIQQPCQQHRLFPTDAGWYHLRFLDFRCLNECHLGYEFEITLESEQNHFNSASILEVQPQNSYSKIALWLTQQHLTGCQAVRFKSQLVPLCQALASIELINTGQIAITKLSEWLTRQGTMPKGRFTVLKTLQHGNSFIMHCQTTDCLSRACYHWLQQQAIRYQLLYVRAERH